MEDGSPDGCPALCDAAAAKDARIRVLHQKNGGLSAARNAGLDVARGEWIGFVDSDDYIAPEMYETLYKAVQSTGETLAVRLRCGLRGRHMRLPVPVFLPSNSATVFPPQIRQIP